MTLRPVPENFDSINVITSVGEELGMVNSQMMKFTHVSALQPLNESV
jgi:hypothetical protein